MRAQTAAITLALALLVPATPALAGEVAGYKGGFFIQAPDGSAKLKIGGRVQFRHEATKAEDVNAESEFSVVRARLKVSGHAFTKDLTYTIQPDFGKGKVSLKDFFTDYAVSSGFKVRIGQYKKPFNREQITSSGKLAFADRTLTDKAFGAGRDIGLMLHNGYEKSPKLEWAVGVFNGTGDNVVPGTFRPTLVGRVGVNTGGLKGYSEADLEGGPLRVGVGASVELDFDADGGDDSSIAAEIDAMLKVSGLTGSLGVYVLTAEKDADGFTSQELAQTGFHAQVSYLVAEHWLPVARYAMIMPDGDDNDYDEAALGLTAFLFGHNVKLTVEAARLGMQSPTGGTSEWRVRSQAQVGF